MGRKLSTGERIVTALAILIPIAGGAVLRKLLKGGVTLAEVAARMGRSEDDVLAGFRALHAQSADQAAVEAMVASVRSGRKLSKDELEHLTRMLHEIDAQKRAYRAEAKANAYAEKHSGSQQGTTEVREPVADEATSGRVASGPGAAHVYDEAFAANRRFESSPKHGGSTRTVGGRTVSKDPADGQAALDFSFPVSNNTRRRIGIDPRNNEFVVFDRTGNLVRDKQIIGGIYHGHVRSWDDLSKDMKDTLKAHNVVDRRGRIHVDSEEWDSTP